MPIRHLLLAAALAVAPLLARADDARLGDDSGSPAAGAEVRVTLRDGKVVQGTLLSREDGAVTLDVAGTAVRIPSSAVRELGPATPVRPRGATRAAFPDPNRTRYLYSPSGFMLRQGEGYLSQTELVLTSVAIGATDWLTLQAGTVLPVVFYDATVMPFVVGAKVGGSPSELVHLAAGVQSFVIPGLSEAPAVGFVFATATLGTEDRHVSVSAGPPFLLARGTSDLGPVLVAVSAAVRVAPRIALVTENWILPVDGSVHAVGSGAIRFLAETLAVDAGLVFFQGSSVPAPWLDFTWHWQ